jgi:hypothetical protein
MEFLRFGSSIPGSYWGCCAVDIIQKFSVHPDDPATIELVCGDGGESLLVDGKRVFAGPTYRDIFWQRLRIGTFDKRDMPNHAFIAILTHDQLTQYNGKAWLALLKEAGFEFVRTITNSVYTGQNLSEEGTTEKYYNNYIFALFRNIGKGSAADQFTPPKEWTNLPQVVPEPRPENPVELTKEIRKAQRKVWDEKSPRPLLTEKECREQKLPIILAGVRSQFPQEEEKIREKKMKKTPKKKASCAEDPFGLE